MTASILTTKLYIPPARDRRVARPRLLARLDAGLRPGCRLVLLSAPAGFGKTTLLSEWIDQRQDAAHKTSAARFCWLSLDEGDNDPARFLRYVTAALQTALPGAGQAALALLQAPVGAEGMVSTEGILDALINDLAAQDMQPPILLVLDDYHQIETPEVHAALAYLIDHLPPQAHLALATRSDPPLPFHRLRARDQISELRVADLRFSPAETAAFLNDVMRLNLSAADIAALESRTEGWIAGLQLASLAASSAQGASSMASFVSDFAGSNRYILDYLAEEVLSQQPAVVQEFLLQTSLLERFCADLCDAVVRYPFFAAEARRLGSAHHQQHLEYLERANLFIVPLDGERRWYRYHNLFAEFLADRLGRLIDQSAPGGRAERARGLHQRASDWFERQGLPYEAIEYALRAADYPRAADLIERHARWAVLVPGETGRMLRWLEVIPNEIAQAHPGLCLTHAWVLLSAGHTPEVEPYVETALRGIATHPEDYDAQQIRSEADALRSLLAVMGGRLEEAIELANRALEGLPEDATLLRSMVALNLGLAYDMRGEPAAAAQVYRQAVALSQAAGNLLVVLIAAVQLADLEMLQGRAAHAEAAYRQAVQLADQLGSLPVTSMAYSGLGHILYEQNRLEEAAAQLERAIRLGQGWESKDIAAISQVFLAQVRLAQGQPAAALGLVEQAAASLRGSISSESTLRSVNAFTIQVWLRAGQAESAARWASDFQANPPPFLQAYLRVVEGATLARALLAAGEPAQAAESAARLLPEAQPGEAIELQALLALALDAQGQREEAIRALAEALERAAVSGYAQDGPVLPAPAAPSGKPGIPFDPSRGFCRTFLDEGLPMARLLRLALARGVQPAYTAALLDAFEPAVMQELGAPSAAQQANRALVEPLSERELDVLRLAAQGLPNPAIAARLVVAVSTVKTHINNIYGKLGVQTRLQAVNKARQLRLID